MNVHVLQHVAFETTGNIESWLRERNAVIGFTRFFKEWSLPDVAGLDLIVVMGGPMSVNDEESLPWLVNEKEFVREAIRKGVAVLGICLGAQMIAGVLGARVYPAKKREIGWFDVEAVPAPEGVFQFPATMTPLHWHGETFDLPKGAVHLARSAGCEHQAFQLGSNVLGLQFHLEATPECASAMIDNCRNELTEGEFVQPEEIIRGAPAAAYSRANGVMEEVLGYLTREDARTGQ